MKALRDLMEYRLVSDQRIPVDQPEGTDTCKVHVFFEHQQERVCRWIERHEAVVGCVAWMTDVRVLEALNGREMSCVVMQKEDWLRPDYRGRHPAATKRGKLLFSRSNSVLINDVLPVNVNHSSKGLEYLPRYRTFGISDPGRRMRGRPVLHHKFMIGCRVRRGCSPSFSEHPETILDPYEVLTGSHNLSSGAENNLDNTVVIESVPIAQSFFIEWASVLGNSQGLDFDANHIDPEWKVGS